MYEKFTKNLKPSQISVLALLSATVEQVALELSTTDQQNSQQAAPPAPVPFDLTDGPWPVSTSEDKKEQPVEKLAYYVYDDMRRSLHGFHELIAVTSRIIESCKLPVIVKSSSLPQPERKVMRGRALANLPNQISASHADRILLLGEFSNLLQDYPNASLPYLVGSRRFTERIDGWLFHQMILNIIQSVGDPYILHKFVDSMDVTIISVVYPRLINKIGFQKHSEILDSMVTVSDGSVFTVQSSPNSTFARVFKDGLTIKYEKSLLTVFDSPSGGGLGGAGVATTTAKQVSPSSATSGNKKIPQDTATGIPGSRISVWSDAATAALNGVVTSKCGDIVRLTADGLVEWSRDTSKETSNDEISRTFSSRAVLRVLRSGRREVFCYDGTYCYREPEDLEWTVVTVYGKKHSQTKSPLSSVTSNAPKEYIPSAIQHFHGDSVSIASNALSVYLIKKGSTTTAIFPDKSRIITEGKGITMVKNGEFPVISCELENDSYFAGISGILDIKMLDCSNIRFSQKFIKLTKSQQEILIDRRNSRISISPYTVDLKSGIIQVVDDSRNEFKFDGNQTFIDAKFHGSTNVIEIPKFPVPETDAPHANKMYTVEPFTANTANALKSNSPSLSLTGFPQPRLFVLYRNGDVEEFLTQKDFDSLSGKSGIYHKNVNLNESVTMHHFLMAGSENLPQFPMVNFPISKRILNVVNKPVEESDHNLVRSLSEYSVLDQSVLDAISTSAASNANEAENTSDATASNVSRYEMETRALRIATARQASSTGDAASIWEQAPKEFPKKVESPEVSASTDVAHKRASVPQVTKESQLETVLLQKRSSLAEFKRRNSRFIVADKGQISLTEKMKFSRNFWMTPEGLDFQTELGGMDEVWGKAKKEKLEKLQVKKEVTPWNPPPVWELNLDDENINENRSPHKKVTVVKPTKENIEYFTPEKPHLIKSLKPLPSGPHPSKRSRSYDVYGYPREAVVDPKGLLETQLEEASVHENTEYVRPENDHTVRISSVFTNIGNVVTKIQAIPNQIDFGHLKIPGVYRLFVSLKNLDVEMTRFHAKIQKSKNLLNPVNPVFRPAPLATGISTTIAIEVVAKVSESIEAELLISTEFNTMKIPIKAVCGERHSGKVEEIDDGYAVNVFSTSLCMVTDKIYCKTVMK
jgi:hypothetical protein